MTEKIQEIVQRVVAGSRDEADLQAIAAALRAGEVVLATGDRAIAIGGDANDSVNVTGNHNQVIVVKGSEAEKIAQLLQQFSAVQTVSVDELLQQVRSRASTKILNLFSQIQLLNKRQVAVDHLYVDVYVLEVRDFRATIPGLLERQDAREQFDRFGLGKREKRSPGLEIAASEDFPRLMVLGKPGSGKSTFLRHLAVSCAKSEFLGAYIPVLLELRDVDEAAFSLFQYLHREFGLEHEDQTEQILKQGQVLLLLDGLDEVPSSLRQKVQHELRKFAKRYDKNRFILTCRTQTTKYIPEQFQSVEVADFKPEQVECFALHWFTAMAGTSEQGMALKTQFMEKLRESPQTAELAVTPVLLSLTCWIFDDMKGLPQKRSDLYREGLDLLLQQWDKGRGISRDSGGDRYHQLTTEERKQLLGYVAVRKFEQAENFVLYEEPELCGYIAEHLQLSVEESRTVLQAIAQQHGLLIERAQGIWSFSHLTFQEYLISKYFCGQNAIEELTSKIIHTHWLEVLSLSTEIIDNPKNLVQAFKKRIDNILCSKELQVLLHWLNCHASYIKNFYHISDQPSAVRAFYLDLILEIYRNPSSLFDFQTTDFYLELKFSFTLDNTINFEDARGAAYYLSNDIIAELEHIIDILIDKNLTQNLTLFESLEQSKTRFPELKSIELREKWWQDYLMEDEYFTKVFHSIRLMPIEGSYLSDIWKFDEEQINSIKQFFGLNTFLVNCLDKNNRITNGVKFKIKEELFLPIAEIEKRKKQSSD